MARYRIQFVARFDHDIDADNIEEAKRIANELQDKTELTIADARCNWNTIEPLND